MIKNAEFVIKWNEIIIIFLVLLVLNSVIRYILANKYKGLVKRFYSDKWHDLLPEVNKLKNTYSRFAIAPWAKQSCQIYNNLCIMSASISLLNGDENSFVSSLDEIKYDDKNEIKHFLSALWKYTKNDIESAKQHYKIIEQTAKCRDIVVVLNNIFLNDYIHGNVPTDELTGATKNFKNPAIIKLLGVIGINQ